MFVCLFVVVVVVVVAFFFGSYQLLFISCDNNSKHKLAKDVTSWQPC